MVKELKNKLKVSDDSLGWKRGTHMAFSLCNLRAQEISQVSVSTTEGSQTRGDGVRDEARRKGEKRTFQHGGDGISCHLTQS